MKENIHVKILSADHTFKVTVNIGMAKSDNTWTQLYDSLFCLLNEDGKVVDFKLVRDRKFETAQSCFISVKERMAESNTSPTLVCLDNCCQWKHKVHNILPDVEVKLDLFHAIQRITKTIPMSHHYRREMTTELRQIFRKSGDQGVPRLYVTPCEVDI